MTTTTRHRHAAPRLRVSSCTAARDLVVTVIWVSLLVGLAARWLT